MPYFRRGSLRPWVESLKERRGGLSGSEWGGVRCVLRQLLQAVGFCHSRGVAHRDVKASP